MKWDQPLPTQGAEQTRQAHGRPALGHYLAAGRHVVHEAAGLSVRGVDGTQEAPGLWQQLAHGGSPHLGEGCPSVHAAEVGQVADEVELVGHDTQARVLQHAQTLGGGGGGGGGDGRGVRARCGRDKTFKANKSTLPALKQWYGHTRSGNESPCSKEEFERSGDLAGPLEHLQQDRRAQRLCHIAFLLHVQHYANQPVGHSLLFELT